MGLVEIACDESGYEGEKLVGGVTDVFAHASVVLDEPTAAECIAELRHRIRSPATVYKANHLQRSKHRAVLLWLLGERGPALGNVQVLLVDKTYLLVSKLTEYLAGGREADELYAAGRRTGGTAWEDFLATGNDLLRMREYPDPVGRFFETLDRLEFEDAALTTIKNSRPYAEQLRAELLTQVIPPLDPLLPAIARAVEYWGRNGGSVAVLHDRQTTLSPERIEQLQLGERLARLEQVEYDLDPRIQLADILAGVVRKIASDQLKGEDDAELTALTRPYVDPRSVWGDPPSWHRLVDSGVGPGA